MKQELLIIEDINNKDEIICALTDLQDEDLNGNNGEKYLWVDTINAECETNLDYLVKVCSESDKTSVCDLAHLYIDTWLAHDGYYSEYHIEDKPFGKNGMALSVMIFTCEEDVSY